MLKEEAIFCEKSYIGEANCTDCKYYGTDTCLSRESHKMAVKALEQDSILDKVIAEIQGLRGCSCSCSDGIIDDVEDIIDKYKAGREE